MNIKNRNSTKFVNRLNGLPQDDLETLAMNIDDINDSNIFFKQAALNDKFWYLCDDIINKNVK